MRAYDCSLRLWGTLCRRIVFSWFVRREPERHRRPRFKNSSLTRWWLILVLIICVARHRMQGMLPKQLCWHLFERTTFSCPIQDKSVTLQQKPCWIAAKKLLWMLVVRQACIGHLGILAKVSGMWTVTKCKASSALKHWVNHCMKSRMCKHEILCSVILGSPCLAWMSVIPIRC